MEQGKSVLLEHEKNGFAPPEGMSPVGVPGMPPPGGPGMPPPGMPPMGGGPMIPPDPSKMKKGPSITIKETYGGKIFEVSYAKGTPGVTPEEVADAQSMHPGVMAQNIVPLPDPGIYEVRPDIVCLRDVRVALRDGVHIYADIYMPKHRTEKLPLLVAWSFFGKPHTWAQEDGMMPGVPHGAISGMTNFESADPAYWCRHDYAVACVSPRGVGNSEGNVSNFGTQDARDGYDFIEWAARQEWCSGKVGMCGNSALSMSQMRIAAEQPPHLAAIAPWDGDGDLYRESVCIGGMDTSRFNNQVVHGVATHQYVEDLPETFKKYPYMNAYWQSKIAQWDKVTVPAYVSAGWCTGHLRGSLECYRRIASPKKWVRIHREMEWGDFYDPANMEDLRKFFDRYLKDIRNGWEFTPRVRMEVMDALDYDFDSCRKEQEFPVARTQYSMLYLNESGSLTDENAADAQEITYVPKNDPIVWEYTFDKDTEIIGYLKLRLWVECRGHNNMDIYCWATKHKANGEFVPIRFMGEVFRGPWGSMRVSRRELDPVLSSDFQPVQAHLKDEYLASGQIVPVEIEMAPTARIWHKGEKLHLEICGHDIKPEWQRNDRDDTFNDNGNGLHVIHCGGKYDSYLQIPVMPPKYESGDFIIR